MPYQRSLRERQWSMCWWQNLYLVLFFYYILYISYYTLSLVCQPIRSCYLMTPFCVTYKASKQMCCLMPWKNGGFVFEGFLYPYVWLMLQKEDMTCQKRKADGTIMSIWGLFCSCVAVCDRFHCPVHECMDGNVFIDTDSHAKHAQVRQNRSPEVQCGWHHFHFFGFVVSIQTVHKVFFHQEKLPLWLLLIRFFQRLSC